MQSIIDFLKANWVAILAIATAAHIVARRVVDLTPSTGDNALLDKLDGVLRLIGLKFDDTISK